jgi:L-ribulose-5-phosphate 3-epimerase
MIAPRQEEIIMHTTRRGFLHLSGGIAAAAWAASRAAALPGAGIESVVSAAGAPKKAVLVSMLPKELSILDRFKLAREVGFEATEVHTVTDPKQAEEMRAASDATGLKIHSVMNEAHWDFPLSSADPEVVRKSVAGMETSLRNAALFKAGTVLLVPDAWKRSQQVIRERILPLAAELKVIVAVEEVWNKFLLSPLEFARYVDEFESAWVKAYFDVGNVVFYGFPQDWIRTLGQRIVRLHLKDFKLQRGAGTFTWNNIGEGDIDWIEVRKALAEIGYDNYMTTEIEGGDKAYLADVSARLDRFLKGARPVT